MSDDIRKLIGLLNKEADAAARLPDDAIDGITVKHSRNEYEMSRDHESVYCQWQERLFGWDDNE